MTKRMLMMALLAAWIACRGAAQDGEGRRFEGERPGEQRREMDRFKEGCEPDAGAGMKMPAGGMECGIVKRLMEIPGLVREIGLTEDQIAALRKAAGEMEAASRKLRSEMEQSGALQSRLLTAASLDEDALMAAVEKAGAARTEMAKLRLRQLILFKKTLTPEQMEKIKNLRGRLREEMADPEKRRERLKKWEENRGKVRERGEQRRNPGETEGARKPDMENFEP
ncbi:MAG: periplasmic heavy metal sensor [Verrucomicrobiota bacterium]|nr:periplasmic heavy metal sensor [Verrucomicrobiota bacterium]